MEESIEERVIDIYLPRYTGVYLLYKSEELVYVGVAYDVAVRLNQHKLSKKSWDKVKYVEEKDYYRAILIENYFIDKYKPKYNKAGSKLLHHEEVNGKNAVYYKKNYPSGWDR